MHLARESPLITQVMRRLPLETGYGRVWGVPLVAGMRVDREGVRV